MKESLLFIQFFKKNLIILLASTLVGCVFGYLLNNQKPTLYTHHTLLELNYPDYRVEDRIILADELVVKLRSDNLERALGLKNNQNVKIYKPAPYAIKIEVVSDNYNLSLIADNYKKHVVENYQVTQIGEVYASSTRPSLSFDILLGLFFGLTIGMVISLVKSYLQNY